MWLYYWEKYGYEKAQSIFLRDYIKDKGHVKKGTAHIENVLSGKLDFLKMVKGNDDSTYLKLAGRLEKLSISSQNINPSGKEVELDLDKKLNRFIQSGFVDFSVL
jgi:hypothetical protein